MFYSTGPGYFSQFECLVSCRHLKIARLANECDHTIILTRMQGIQNVQSNLSI